MPINGGEILTSFGSREIAQTARGVLFNLIPDKDIREKVVRAMRIEITRTTATQAKIPTDRESLRVAKSLLEEKRLAIADSLANNTCLKDRAKSQEVALAVVKTIEDIINMALE